ncbi:MAG: hypothetical protein CMP56_04850 [Flavobacteriales bacterium]|jgi:hypothetical protein|nr:hypothetical protein [Flavobacteriales bacterium]
MAWLNKLLLCFIFSLCLFAQDDLESFLDPITETTNVINTFKSTRIINNHSVEMFDTKQLDFRISHRFGLLNTGAYELYGLDQAKIRIGLEYGLIKNMMIGIGRSSYQKTYDGYIKYALIQQTKGQKQIPFSCVYFSNVAINSERKGYTDYPVIGRMSFSNQLLIASKINTELSIQIMPTWIHWNMVQLNSDPNDIMLVGLGFRYLITKSLSINAEYLYRLNESDYNKDIYHNSFSIGVDIETGGHVFQLHISNSMPMHESGFMTRTQSDWLDGGVHFGFNISREFNL